ncbi:MAG: hypothetical protein ACK4FJ_10160 [Ferrovibrio sp.]|uniref:hypothetical protein n=1 Tax=Ferrovibrio sp. TaxID=1917215 RepID=UPI00391A8351
MAREAYDPFKDEAIHQKKPSKPLVRVDWKLAARRVAEGAGLATVVAELGITEEHFWRHLRRSLRFRFLLEQAVERRAGLIALQSRAALPAAVLDRCLQADSLDDGLLTALLTDTEAVRASDAPAGDSSGLIGRLAETGRHPPNMAFRRRLAAERQKMDATFAAISAQAAAKRAQPDEPARTEAKSSQPERSETDPNGPERSQTDLSGPKTDLNGPERSQMDLNGPERCETEPNPSSVRTRPGEYNPWPDRPPRHLVPTPPEPRSRAALLGTIVDLEGPDLARIRAMGGLDPPESAEADGG